MGVPRRREVYRILVDDYSLLVQPTILAGSKDSWKLDCYYLRARVHKKGLTSCSKPKKLFLQSQEVLQENEPDRR